MNPQMLTLLRESRGLSQSGLARATGIPQPTISKAENGLGDLDEVRLQVVASQLQYPVEVFSWTDPIFGFGNAAFHHRKQQSLAQTKLRKIHAAINLARMRMIRLLRSVDVNSRNTVPSIEVEELGSAEEVARAVRAAWMLPMGPINNMVRTLENAGVVVVRHDLESPRISAISTMTGEGPPMMILNIGQPPCRERFSLAHELGHLVMHSIPRAPAEAEREADAFASEFLMPAAEIRSQLINLDLRKAAQLQLTWKVSMGALVRRAKDLGRIDESRYKSLVVRMSQQGWLRHEPVQIDMEEPRFIPAVLAVHRDDHGYKATELATVIGLYESEFESAYRYTDAERGLRLVH